MTEPVTWYETIEGKLTIGMAVLIVVLALILVRPDQPAPPIPETNAIVETSQRSKPLRPFTAAELPLLEPQDPPADTPPTADKQPAVANPSHKSPSSRRSHPKKPPKTFRIPNLPWLP